jgi:chromate transporter
MQAIFYGVGATVIGIITKSAYRLTKVALKNSRLLWGIFVVMCSVTAMTGKEIVWLFILSGVVALVVLAPPSSLLRSAQRFPPFLGAFLVPLPSTAGDSPFMELFLFFARAGAFVFGSGLAIVPFLHGGVVGQFHWLNERQFLDAVAVAMITPGPVVITVGFIGYLVGNLPGAAAAALGVFLPVWLVVVLLSPIYEKIAGNVHVTAFVRGVTAAATGAIAGAVIVLGRRALIDIPTALIALASLSMLLKFKLPEPVIIALAGGMGLLIHGIQ